MMQLNCPTFSRLVDLDVRCKKNFLSWTSSINHFLLSFEFLLLHENVMSRNILILTDIDFF